MQHESTIPGVSLLFNHGKKGLVMGNQYTRDIDYTYRLSILQKHIDESCPDWEYVRGYTNSDGKVILRNKICGHEKEVSCITIRKTKGKVICRECSKEKKQTEKLRKHKLIEYKKAIMSVNQEQMMLRKCPMCRAFYFGYEKDRFCSKECKAIALKKYVNRYKEIKRKRCKTDESKYINLASLYERDRGICWLCGKPCDMSLDTNDNYYPSIDHVYPVAKGGKDTWDNVRLAHRICNTRKATSTGVSLVDVISLLSKNEGGG